MVSIFVCETFDDVYTAIFQILDNIPELTGDDAGRIATIASAKVTAELTKLLDN